MNELQNVFKYEGRDVRTFSISEAPWFVAKDVCEVLGIGNPTMALARLDDDEKGLSSIETLGGPQQMVIVNEPGLYTLVIGSRKPDAKNFKRWLTHEVIPSLRRTGTYTMTGAQPALMAQMTEALSTITQMAASMQMRDARLDRVEHTIEHELTLKNHSQTLVKNAVKNRVGILEPDIIDGDGKKKRNPKRAPIYTQLYADIYKHFGVESYRDIKPRDFETAVEFIRNWSPAVPLTVAR